jgi:hypothetical protein
MLKISQRETIGYLVMFWALSQDDEVHEATGEDIAILFDPEANFDPEQVVHALVRAEFITPLADDEQALARSYEIRGNKKHISVRTKRRKAGKSGGKSSSRSTGNDKRSKQNASICLNNVQANASKPGKQNASICLNETPHLGRPNAIESDAVQSNLKKPATGSSDPPPPKKRSAPITKATWEAYADAYVERYNCEPVRNARVNSQMAAFVRSVGEEAAPHIARFYVAHNKAYYVSKQHAVGPLVQDAEGLYTQWKTNRTVTSKEARSAESKGHFVSQMDRINRGEI